MSSVQPTVTSSTRFGHTPNTATWLASVDCRIAVRANISGTT